MIANEQDIRQWAAMIVEANGEKFTVLTKGDQYLIAKYILSMAESTGTQTAEPPQETGEQEQAAKREDTHANMEEPPKAAVKEALEHPVRTVTMTRGYAYHRAGFKAQEVYDKFLADAKENNADLKVMDFATGRQSVDAAFAYWLAQTIEVDLPPSVRAV